MKLRSHTARAAAQASASSSSARPVAPQRPEQSGSKGRPVAQDERLSALPSRKRSRSGSEETDDVKRRRTDAPARPLPKAADPVPIPADLVGLVGYSMAKSVLHEKVDGPSGKTLVEMAHALAETANAYKKRRGNVMTDLAPPDYQASALVSSAMVVMGKLRTAINKPDDPENVELARIVPRHRLWALAKQDKTRYHRLCDQVLFSAVGQLVEAGLCDMMNATLMEKYADRAQAGQRLQRVGLRQPLSHSWLQVLADGMEGASADAWRDEATPMQVPDTAPAERGDEVKTVLDLSVEEALVVRECAVEVLEGLKNNASVTSNQARIADRQMQLNRAKSVDPNWPKPSDLKAHPTAGRLAAPGFLDRADDAWTRLRGVAFGPLLEDVHAAGVAAEVLDKNVREATSPSTLAQVKAAGRQFVRPDTVTRDEAVPGQEGEASGGAPEIPPST